MIDIRRRLVQASLALALLGASVAQAAPPPAPKLVVAISVDQLALDLFERYAPTFTGGLKRMGEGVSFDGYQSHAATETCPGHSTLLTGDHPARTGIVANSWYDRATGSNVYCVSVDGVADPQARGTGRLKVDALGDWLKRAKPGARSIAVSGKDRAAIMMAGKRPDAVYWWVDKQGFSTSKYAGPATPAVLAPAKAFDKARLAAWRARPPRLWPTSIPTTCAALQAPHWFGALSLSGEVPPQTTRRGVVSMGEERFSEELRASPIFDPMTLDFASALVEQHKLGRRRQPDLLAVSLSATDLIGHRYGNGGAEMCVQLASLDLALGRFLDRLDRSGVPYVVVLTADHGAVDAAERLGPPGKRLDTRAVLSGLAAHLKSTFGLTYDPLVGDDSRQLILALAPQDDARRPAILADAVAWLKERPEIAAAFTAEEIAAVKVPPGKAAWDLTLPERFAESFDAARSGDILLAYDEGATLGEPKTLGDTVAGHGSPWDYDRRVPILFWWRGVTPRQMGQMETVDIAPTLAALLRITPPAVDGRCIDLGRGCPK